MGKILAIVQSNYIPWKGYFDMIRRADEFVLYDDVQYTRRDWRNRNRIKTAQGTQWLTIPVQVKGKYYQTVKDTKISDPDWGRTHWRTLCHCYGNAPHFKGSQELWEPLYLGCRHEFLSDINRAWIAAICGQLGIGTRISQSMDYHLHEADPTSRLLEICVQAGASVYLSGPAARSYLDETLFQQAGIEIRYMDYSGYREYPQLYPPFDHAVTVLDLLFMVGPLAPRYLERETHAA
jgi:WbqC-like protein family